METSVRRAVFNINCSQGIPSNGMHQVTKVTPWSDGVAVVAAIASGPRLMLLMLLAGSNCRCCFPQQAICLWLFACASWQYRCYTVSPQEGCTGLAPLQAFNE